MKPWNIRKKQTNNHLAFLSLPLHVGFVQKEGPPPKQNHLSHPKPSTASFTSATASSPPKKDPMIHGFSSRKVQKAKSSSPPKNFYSMIQKAKSSITKGQLPGEKLYGSSPSLWWSFSGARSFQGCTLAGCWAERGIFPSAVLTVLRCFFSFTVVSEGFGVVLILFASFLNCFSVGSPLSESDVLVFQLFLSTVLSYVKCQLMSLLYLIFSACSRFVSCLFVVWSLF